MSKMRSSVLNRIQKSFLEGIRTIGNYSGCHQLPERSFFYHGYQFPVCARCTGVFLGHITAILLFLLKKQIAPGICIFFLGVMGADWAIQETGLKDSTNPRRMITGFLGGLGLFSFYGYLIRKIIILIKK